MGGDRKVGVAMDFSKNSKRALGWAINNLLDELVDRTIPGSEEEDTLSVGPEPSVASSISDSNSIASATDEFSSFDAYSKTGNPSSVARPALTLSVGVPPAVAEPEVQGSRASSRSGGGRSVFLTSYVPLWGRVSIWGRRPEMEDAVVAVPRFFEIPLRMLTSDCVVDGMDPSLISLPAHLFGVYDGHGGAQLPSQLINSAQGSSLMPSLLSHARMSKYGLAPPRATDLGWAYGMMVNGDRHKIQCKYCLKVILGGGISRLKQHLAGERGNIAPCEKVPDDIKTQMQQHLWFKTLERLKKQKDSEVVTSSIQQSRDGYDSEILNAISIREASGKSRGKELDEGSPDKRKRIKKLHVPQASPIPQCTVQHTFASQESINQADIAVAKFMYDTGIPFNAANSIYFQRMADAIATAGPGYKMPSCHSLRGKLLNSCVHEVGEICKELRKSWEVTGCTVMADRWMDKTDRAFINFFIYCPKGTMFLKSVDASDIENTSEGLLSVFDGIVHDVGPGNIVNFITDSAPCYKAAGRALMNKYKTFFWSVCANHCIELMLKGLTEMDEVNELLTKAKKICQLVYNNAWVLNLLREKTEGRDIIQHALTEFVMNFLTLQNIVSFKACLQQIFTGTTWEQSSLSKQRMGMDVKEIVLDLQFWESCAKIIKVSKPLITVLNLLDSRERPSMGYLYDSMEKAKKEISSAFDNKESDYLPYLEVIGHALDELHNPLHAAAYYLNPSTYFNPNFSMNNVIQKGLLDCIETLEPNLAAQDNITKHKASYEDAVGDFSRPVALRGRESLSPATWWSLYASDYPDLRRFAVRILSQTCSITKSERTGTMNESVHLRKNRLEHERLNDLTFVHHNLHLQERQTVTFVSKALSRGEDDLVCLEGRIDHAGDWIADPGVLEGGSINWIDVALPSDPAVAKEKVSNSGNGNLGDDDGGSNEGNKSDGSVVS